MKLLKKIIKSTTKVLTLKAQLKKQEQMIMCQQLLLNHLFDIQCAPKATGILRNIQLFYTRVLKSFDEFCCKHNISYWIYYGTLLGAIRHKGFIPWDYDVDIVMTREEYEKFKKCFANEKPFYNSIANGKLILVGTKKHTSTRLRFNTPLSKSLSEDAPYLQIDILILDEYKVNKDKLQEFTKAVQKSKKLVSTYYKRNKKVTFKNLTEYSKKIITNNLQSPQWQKGEGKIDTYFVYGLEQYPIYEKKRPELVISSTYTFPLTRVKFENIELNSPKDYSTILSIEFGSWLQFPTTNEGMLNYATIYKDDIPRLKAEIQYFYDNKMFTPITSSN